jgi:hypothetical protein
MHSLIVAYELTFPELTILIYCYFNFQSMNWVILFEYNFIIMLFIKFPDMIT